MRGGVRGFAAVSALAALACISALRGDAAADLAAARAALRDGLYPMAVSFAQAAQSDGELAADARVVEIEALAAEGRASDVRARLAEWGDPEDFGYWVLWCEGQMAAARGDMKSAVAAFEKGDSLLGTNKLARAGNAVTWSAALMAAGSAAEARKVLERSGAAAAGGVVGAEAKLLLSEMLAKSSDTNDVARANALLAELAGNGAAGGEVRRRAGYALAAVELSKKATFRKGSERTVALVREFPDAPESRDAMLRFGNAQLAAGDAAAAEKTYRDFLDAYPDAAFDAHALEGRAWALLKLGRTGEAIGTFERAAKTASNDVVRARCLFKEGDAFVADGRMGEAADAYGRAAKAAAGEFAERALFHQADACYRAGRVEAAGKTFQELADKTQSVMRAQSALRLAMAEAAADQSGKAVKMYTIAVESARDDGVRARALVGRGRMLYRTYSYKEAAADFAAAAKTGRVSADEMDFLVALCMYGEGREAEARREVEKISARVTDPALGADLELWLAKCDFVQGEWDSAEKRFAACSSNTVDAARSADALVWAAKTAMRRNAFEAVVDYVAAAKNKGLSGTALASALVLQGEALVELARFDQAVLVLERAALAAPDDDAVRRAATLKADALFAMGADNDARYQAALDAYRAALRDARLSPGEALAVQFKIGRTLEKLRRTKEADAQYYQNVVKAFNDGRKEKKWYDDAARAFFTRAAFALADREAARGERQKAVNILRYVETSGLPAAKDATSKIKELESKGGF